MIRFMGGECGPRIQVQGGIGLTDLFGEVRASFLGLRSWDSLRPPGYHITGFQPVNRAEKVGPKKWDIGFDDG